MAYNCLDEQNTESLGLTDDPLNLQPNKKENEEDDAVNKYRIKFVCDH